MPQAPSLGPHPPIPSSHPRPHKPRPQTCLPKPIPFSRSRSHHRGGGPRARSYPPLLPWPHSAPPGPESPPRGRVTCLHGRSHPSLNQPGLHNHRDHPGPWPPPAAQRLTDLPAPHRTPGGAFQNARLASRQSCCSTETLRHGASATHLPSRHQLPTSQAGCTVSLLEGQLHTHSLPRHTHCHQDHPADTAFSGPDIPQTHSHMLTAIRVILWTWPSLA